MPLLFCKHEYQVILNRNFTKYICTYQCWAGKSITLIYPWYNQIKSILYLVGKYFKFVLSLFYSASICLRYTFTQGRIIVLKRLWYNLHNLQFQCKTRFYHAMAIDPTTKQIVQWTY
jgi:hypothetical protein